MWKEFCLVSISLSSTLTIQLGWTFNWNYVNKPISTSRRTMAKTVTKLRLLFICYTKTQLASSFLLLRQVVKVYNRQINKNWLELIRCAHYPNTMANYITLYYTVGVDDMNVVDKLNWIGAPNFSRWYVCAMQQTYRHADRGYAICAHIMLRCWNEIWCGEGELGEWRWGGGGGGVAVSIYAFVLPRRGYRFG